MSLDCIGYVSDKAGGEDGGGHSKRLSHSNHRKGRVCGAPEQLRDDLHNELLLPVAWDSIAVNNVLCSEGCGSEALHGR